MQTISRSKPHWVSTGNNQTNKWTSEGSQVDDSRRAITVRYCDEIDITVQNKVLNASKATK